MEGAAPAPMAGPGKILVFRLGAERYGLPLECVRELQRVPAVTPVPRLPAFVAGVANLRGNVIGLIDLRAVVGASPAPVETSAARRMMVVSVDGLTAGVLVDRVEGVEAEGEMDPPVATLPDALRRDPASLARLLETSPVVDQGGLTYERGDTVAVFARGTSQLPSEWSAFFVQCHENDMCAMVAPSPSGAP